MLDLFRYMLFFTFWWLSRISLISIFCGGGGLKEKPEEFWSLVCLLHLNWSMRAIQIGIITINNISFEFSQLPFEVLIWYFLEIIHSFFDIVCFEYEFKTDYVKEIISDQEKYLLMTAAKIFGKTSF